MRVCMNSRGILIPCRHWRLWRLEQERKQHLVRAEPQIAKRFGEVDETQGRCKLIIVPDNNLSEMEGIS